MPNTNIRKRLRDATLEVHQRLHGHDGFNAVATGAISRSDYALLLARLWGFHRPFEAILEKAVAKIGVSRDLEGRRRREMLKSDLATLGATLESIDSLPQCEWLRPMESLAEVMGAMYVVEGSTLGGLHLARALGPLFGAETAEGRRFFLGYGERHGAMWRSFLSELEQSVTTVDEEVAVIEGALRTFEIFETWMNDWRAASCSPTTARAR
jgi:heme oxygenase